ncbi:MAG: DUF1343 domain-containing protein [Candidatus Kapabacteria bacterium]|nr:DUF1343 domain-containing protein [Candidatus Kapabacteria bacterium]
MIRTLLILMMLAGQITSAQVKCGIDNIIDTDFTMFKGQRVALVTHAAARTLGGRSTAEAFLQRTDLTVVRIMAPEHGFYGVITAGESVPTDTIYDGVPVLSLYGERRRPSAEMIADVDRVVIDMQDIGVRSYTYISTMVEVMEACAERNVPIVILDRPNPLGGSLVDGSIVEDSLRSFVGRLPIPYIHGCTMGELATMANGAGWLSADPSGRPRQCSLTVVKCKRWKRSMAWEQTGRTWYPTSPNIPSVNAIRGYAVTGLAGELSLLNIGIGTATPFTVIGAPDLVHDASLVQRMASCGVRLMETRYVPPSGKHARTRCLGYHLGFDASVRPYLAALTLLHAFAERSPSMYVDSVLTSPKGRMFMKTSGRGALLGLLRARRPWRDLASHATDGMQDFVRRREAYLLYD